MKEHANLVDVVEKYREYYSVKGIKELNQKYNLNASDIDEKQALKNAQKSFEKMYDRLNKDVMTNPGMSEPGKNVNDWDAGVPKGDSKPWAGKNGNSKPFEKKVKSELSESEEEVVEEANLSQSRWNDTHAAHNRVPAANDDAHRRDGMQKTSKGTKYRAHGTSETTEESKKLEKALAESKEMMAKVDSILKENEEFETKFYDVGDGLSVSVRHIEENE